MNFFCLYDTFYSCKKNKKFEGLRRLLFFIIKFIYSLNFLSKVTILYTNKINTTMFKNFEDFKEFCKMIANQQHTMVEFHEYPEYNWAQAAFMTDAFGGTYCAFKFDYNTLEIIDTFEKDSKPYTNIADIIIHIAKQQEYEEKHRNLSRISELINDEY